MAAAGKSTAKEVNSSLKAAKDAIKQKEYKEALKHCKNVIKLDKANYHAFVFIGLCAKEMQQFDQSRAAYRKAIEQNSEQILAWQGLCNLYEAAENEDWKYELVEVYSKLISASKNDLPKWKELLSKLIPLQLSLDMPYEAVQHMKELEGTTPEPCEDSLNLWKKCLQLFESKVQKGEISEETKAQMENAYQSVLEYSRVLGIDSEKTQCDHLHFLVNSIKETNDKSVSGFLEKRILEKGSHFLEQYPNNLFGLDLMIRIHLEQSEDFSTNAIKFLQQLTTVDATNPLCVIGTAQINFQQSKWKDALTNLQDIEGFMKKNHIPSYWLLMSKLYNKIHDFKSSVIYADTGLKGLQKCLTETGKVVYHHAFIIAKVTSLVALKDYEKARDLLLEMIKEEPISISAYHLLGVSYCYLGDNENALEVCSNMLKMEPDFHGYLEIKALISINEEKFYDAELRLQEAIEIKPDISKYHFLLGSVYWNLRKDENANAKKAHSCFLKAAQLDPSNSEVFLALGNYYRHISADLRKAQKCFKKAVSLNEFYEEACLAFGDVSMDLNDEDAALEIYEKTTKNFGPGRVKTAWLRRGMLLTKRGSPEQAVTCFVGAIRCDPSDKLLWECLGDAYIARGSYIPAMKAFEKALELDPTSLYCRYKVGVIKQSICVYSEAIDDFEKVVATQQDFIPAMKGIADCHLKLEYASIEENFDGRAVEHAGKVLSIASRAIELRPDLRCFWKTIGDACFGLDVIAEEKLRVEIPSHIVKVLGIKTQNEQKMKSTLLDISRRCYAVIVKFEDTSAGAWHDFAISTFHYGMSLDDEDGKAMIKQSIQYIKKAISLNPQDSKLWNTLGVISASSDTANPDVSQHAFIKALQLQPQSADVWTNLGTLYLKYDKTKEAHEAFKKAQDADPSYTPAWVGQASIAEIIGDEDAMDLYRHSSELGSNAEAFLSYAKWVCYELREFYCKGKPHSRRTDSRNLPPTIRKAIANATVCVQKYTDRFCGNPCAFNLLGVLLEHQMLHKQAQQAFQRALDILSSSDDNEKRNMVQSNLARVLRQSGQSKHSIEVYLKMQPLIKADDVIGLALSYFLDGQLKESFQAYEQALSLTEDEREKSDILVAMGMVAYATGNFDLAKSFLFKSSQTQSPSEQGLKALSALGLLSKDDTLTNAALAEIEKHPDFRTESLEGDYAYLKSTMNLLQGDIIQAKRCIQKTLRRYPESAKLWNRLAICIHETSPVLSMHIAGRCAVISSIHQPSDLSLMITASASIGSKSFALTSSDKNAHVDCLRAAQKAVHSNPERPENWALLAAASLANSVIDRNQCNATTAISTARLVLLKAEENQTKLDESLKTTVSQQLMPKIKLAIKLRIYAIKILIWAYLYNGAYDIALLLSDNAITQYEEDPAVANELLFLKIISEILMKSKQDESINELISSAISICEADDESCWKYQVLFNLCLKLGYPQVSEFAIRKCVQHAAQNGLQTTHFISLIRLALMSIGCYSKDKNERWLALAAEAVTEATRMNPENSMIDFIRLNLFHAKNDVKNGKKILERLRKRDDVEFAPVVNQWISLYNLEEKDLLEQDVHET